MIPLNNQYGALLTPLAFDQTGGVKQKNDRTGDIMYRHDGPRTLSVDLTWGVPVPRWRRLSPHIPFADTIWQMTGTTNLTWLNKYAAFIWGPYAEDDELPKAYGDRWAWQLDLVIDHLSHDPTSRQVYMSTWEPLEDLEDSPRAPMPPCILGIQFRVTEVGLEASVFMRSCDIMVGLPHDLMNMCFLTHLVAHELDIPAGQVHFLISDLHLYEGHRAAARQLLARSWPKPLDVPIPTVWTREYITNPEVRDDLVIRMRDEFRPVIAQVPNISMSITR